MPRKTAYADQASEELREIVRHAGALLDATAGEADEHIQKVRQRLEERLEAAKDKYADIEGLFDETVATADRMVRDKPYHVVGGSFLLGLFLGWFMSRK
ncbi:DUF883 family protein [Solidesulfovibrio sp. C21]|uniref:DUF883 family protein n=1 Tax=Solidesulfovibrio sp. C21 TaxID=3398613 RepID=UPI0039FBB22B